MLNLSGCLVAYGTEAASIPFLNTGNGILQCYLQSMNTPPILPRPMDTAELLRNLRILLGFVLSAQMSFTPPRFSDTPMRRGSGLRTLMKFLLKLCQTMANMGQIFLFGLQALNDMLRHGLGVRSSGN